jgi:small conductance mechanosensitive channel
LPSPEPVAEILQLNRAGTVMAVRPFCKNENCWQVYFDTNRTLRDVFMQEGYPSPDTANVPRVD